MIASELSSGEALCKPPHYFEDLLPRGPAGCLRDHRDWTGPNTLICIQGTAWYDFDLQAMLEEHRHTHAAITVGALQTNKNKNLEPAGVYLIEPHALDLVPPVGYHDLKEQFIPHALAAGMKVRCHKLSQTTLIHSPEHYLAAMQDAIPRAAANPPPGFIRRNNAIIHKSATIHTTAHLDGNIWIDANTTIEENAILLGPVVLAPNSTVGPNSLIRRSVALRNTHIPPNAEAFSRILSPTKE